MVGAWRPACIGSHGETAFLEATVDNADWDVLLVATELISGVTALCPVSLPFFSPHPFSITGFSIKYVGGTLDFFLLAAPSQSSLLALPSSG